MTDGPMPPTARFQCSLRLLFWWITAVCLVCGSAQGLIAYLRYVEAQNGFLPLETVGRSLFFGFLMLAAFVGLTIGPPLCYVVSLFRSRRRVERVAEARPLCHHEAHG